MTPGLRMRHRSPGEDSRTSLGLMGCNAAPLCRRTLMTMKRISTVIFPVMCHSPSNAMSSDVFPDPVGPTIRLILPRWNRSSSSIVSTKCRLRVPPGVREAAVLLDQENDACRIPTAPVRSSGTTFDRSVTSPEPVFSENSSMSSV